MKDNLCDFINKPHAHRIVLSREIKQNFANESIDAVRTSYMSFRFAS